MDAQRTVVEYAAVYPEMDYSGIIRQYSSLSLANSVRFDIAVDASEERHLSITKYPKREGCKDF